MNVPIEHPAFTLGVIYEKLLSLKGSFEASDLARQDILRQQLSELLKKHPTLDISPEYYDAMHKAAKPDERQP